MAESNPEFPSSLRERFLPLRLLGKGAFGAVFLARDTQLDRLIAVKTLHHPNPAETTRERFKREAQIASSVHSPYVVEVFDFVLEPSGTGAILYRFVEGGSLKSILAARQKLPIAELLPLAKGFSQGLAAIHAAGVIHRDLKPENLLVTSDQIPMIADLGLALQGETLERLTQTGVTPGSPLYLAPEIWFGKDASPQSDLWSLAASLYECWSGLPAYQGNDFLSIRKSLASPQEIPFPEPADDLEAEFASCLRAALAKSPSERCPSAETFAESLARLRPRADPSSPPPRSKTERTQTGARTGRSPPQESSDLPPTEPLRRRKRFPPLAYLSASLLVLSGLAVFSTQWQARTQRQNEEAQKLRQERQVEQAIEKAEANFEAARRHSYQSLESIDPAALRPPFLLHPRFLASSLDFWKDRLHSRTHEALFTSFFELLEASQGRALPGASVDSLDYGEGGLPARTWMAFLQDAMRTAELLPGITVEIELNRAVGLFPVDFRQELSQPLMQLEEDWPELRQPFEGAQTRFLRRLEKVEVPRGIRPSLASLFSQREKKGSCRVPWERAPDLHPEAAGLSPLGRVFRAVVFLHAGLDCDLSTQFPCGLRYRGQAEVLDVLLEEWPWVPAEFRLGLLAQLIRQAILKHRGCPKDTSQSILPETIPLFLAEAQSQKKWGRLAQILALYGAAETYIFLSNFPEEKRAEIDALCQGLLGPIDGDATFPAERYLEGIRARVPGEPPCGSPESG